LAAGLPGAWKFSGSMVAKDMANFPDHIHFFQGPRRGAFVQVSLHSFGSSAMARSAQAIALSCCPSRPTIVARLDQQEFVVRIHFQALLQTPESPRPGGASFRRGAPPGLFHTLTSVDSNRSARSDTPLPPPKTASCRSSPGDVIKRLIIPGSFSRHFWAKASTSGHKPCSHSSRAILAFLSPFTEFAKFNSILEGPLK